MLAFTFELSLMSRFRLMMICLCLALSCSTWARGLRAQDSRIGEHADEPARHQEKFAGRAGNVPPVVDAQNKSVNTQSAVHAQEAHEKKPLSKEERRALRRQINETENKYPRRN